MIDVFATPKQKNFAHRTNALLSVLSPKKQGRALPFSKKAEQKCVCEAHPQPNNVNVVAQRKERLYACYSRTIRAFAGVKIHSRNTPPCAHKLRRANQSADKAKAKAKVQANPSVKRETKKQQEWEAIDDSFQIK